MNNWITTSSYKDMKRYFMTHKLRASIQLLIQNELRIFSFAFVPVFPELSSLLQRWMHSCQSVCSCFHSSCFHLGLVCCCLFPIYWRTYIVYLLWSAAVYFVCPKSISKVCLIEPFPTVPLPVLPTLRNGRKGRGRKTFLSPPTNSLVPLRNIGFVHPKSLRQGLVRRTSGNRPGQV